MINSNEKAERLLALQTRVNKALETLRKSIEEKSVDGNEFEIKLLEAHVKAINSKIKKYDMPGLEAVLENIKA